MKPGAIFKNEIRITPGADDSFIVRAGEDLDFGRIAAPHYGFTNLSDLLNWLVANAQAIAAEKVAEQVTQMAEADIVKPSLLSRIGLAEAGTRRTTAAEVIAEREARTPFSSGLSAAEMAAHHQNAANRDPAA